MYIGLKMGMGAAGTAIITVLFWLRNVLTLAANIGANSIFSRGGSTVTVPAWDATLGLVLITTAADAIASPGMRYDAGTWYNDDGGGNSLHPTNAAGVYLVYQSWVNASIYAANSYAVDFVGNHAKYYKTVLGGTSSGTGVADDTGVTDWVLQGNYTNLGGGELPGLLSEPVAVELIWPTNDFTHANHIKIETTIDPNVITGPDGVAGSGSKILETAVSSTHTLRYTLNQAASVGCLAPIIKAGERQWVALQVTTTTGGSPYILFDTINKVFGVGTALLGTYGFIDYGNGWLQPWLKVTGAGSVTQGLLYVADSNSAAGYLGDITKGIYIFHQSLQLDADSISSPIYTTTGAVQRNASVETNPHIFTARFLRFRVTKINTETYLTDATNSFDYDADTTTLTFTDGTTTLTTITALVVGDTIALDQTDGKLYVNGVLKDTDVLLAPTWTAITGIGNITDLTEGATIDPLDSTWDKV